MFSVEVIVIITKTKWNLKFYAFFYPSSLSLQIHESLDSRGMEEQF